AFPNRIAELVKYLAMLAWHNVPLLQRSRVVAALGSRHVEAVELRSLNDGERKHLNADALCVGYGFRPNSELAQLMGCDCNITLPIYDVFPNVDEYGRTSRPEIFVAGETAGIA